MLTNIISTIFIIFIVFIIFCSLFNGKVFKTKSGYTVRATDEDTANVMDELISMAHDVPNKLKEPYSSELRDKSKNTSYVEIIGGNKKIVGWNKGKGREIGIRIMKNEKVPYSAKMIVDTLLHELAHSITDSFGHGEEWDDNNDYFQKLRPHYVELLKNKTFIKH